MNWNDIIDPRGPYQTDDVFPTQNNLNRSCEIEVTGRFGPLEDPTARYEKAATVYHKSTLFTAK